MDQNTNPWTQEPQQPKQQPQQQAPQAWDERTFAERFGRPGTPQELEALESQLGESGIKVSRNAAGVAGKVILPNGQYVDVINSAGLGGRGFQWLTGEGGGGGGTSGWAPSDPYAAQRGQLFNLLWQRANQPLNVNPKDPVIAGQVNAFGAQQQRGLRNHLSQLAEQSGPQANLAMETRMGNEKAAQSSGMLQAQLMQNEVNARRQEIMQALSQYGGLLSQEQSMALQRELAALNQDRFMRELGLRAQQQAWQQNAYDTGLFG